VETTEGTEISRLISGYIDIIIKKRNQLHTMAQDKKGEEKAMVEDYARPQKSAKVTLVTNANSKQSAKVLQAVSYASNIEPAIRDGHREMMGEDAETVEGQSLLMKQLNQGLLSMDGVLQEMYIPIQLPPVSQDTASIKWRSDTFDMSSENVKAHITAIMAALGILIKSATGDKLRMDFEKMGHQLTTYFSSVIEIGQSLRFLSALDSQDNPNNEDELLSSSKAMVESMSDFVKEYKAVTTGYTLLDKLHQSSRVVSDNGFKLFSAVGGSQLFESVQKELINSAVEVQIAMDQLVGCGKKISKDFTDAQSKHVLEYHTLEALASSAVLVANTMVLGNYMVGSICKEQLIAVTDTSRKQTDEIYTLCSNCPDEQLFNELHKAIQGTDDSLGYLIERSKMTYTGLDYEIVHCINQICYSTDGLENDVNDKEALFSSAKHLTVNATKLVECLKLAAAEATNYEQQTHLTKEAENLAALIGSVVAATRSVIKNFSDKNAKAKLLESVFQQKEGSLIAGDHYLKNDIFQQLIAAMESAVLTSILAVSAARHSSLSNRNRENMLALTKSGKDCNATVPQSINAAKNLKNNMYNHYYRAKLIQAATCFVGPADAMVKGGLKSISDITDNYSKIHLNSLCNTLNSDVLRLKKLLENEIYYFNEVEFADALMSKVESPPNTQTLSMAEAEIIEHSKILLASLNDAVGKISDISSNGWRSDITTAMTEYHNIKGIFTNPNISEDQKLYGELMNASDRVGNSIREMIISSKKKDALEMGQNVGKSSQNVGTLIDSLPQKKAILQSLGNIRKMTNVGFKVSEVERTGAEFVEGDLERQDALLSVAADLSAAIQALANGSKGNEAELKSNMEKLKKQYGNLISVSNDMSKRGQGGNFGTVVHSIAKELDSFLGSLQHSFKDTGSEEFGAQVLLAARNVTDTIDGLYGIFSAENSAGEVCGKSLQKINTASGHVSNINAPKPQNKTYEEITHYAQTALSALREHQTIFKNALSSMDGSILANEGLIITAEMEKLIGNSIHGAHILAAADPQSQNAQPSSINQDFVLTTCKLLRDSASKITNKEATPASSYENSGTIVNNVGVLCQETSQTDRLNDIDPHLKKEIVSLAQALAQSTSILDPVIKNMKPNSREWLATVEPLKADFLQKLLDLETLCKLKNFTGKSAKPGRTAITLQAPILEASTVAIESARNAVELIKGGTLAQSKGKLDDHIQKTIDSCADIVNILKNNSPAKVECNEAIQKIKVSNQKIISTRLQVQSGNLPTETSVANFQTFIEGTKSTMENIEHILESAAIDSQKSVVQIVELPEKYQFVSIF
jgi:talin